MYWLIFVMSLSLLGVIGLGIYYEFRPVRSGKATRSRLKATVAANLITFVAAQLGILVLGIQDAMAQTGAAAAGGDISIGTGLAMIGIGIPTALATVGAGIAVGPVGAASLAVVAEKPEIFGRTLVYLGLAEGIAIYGLVMSILLLGRL